LVLLWPQLKRGSPRALALGALAGLSIYAYLPLAARANPPVNWGNPSTWDGFWWVVSGKIYRGYLFALPLRDLAARLGAWARLWSGQFGWIGLVLALVGLWSWYEAGKRAWFWATVLTFTGYTAYAIGYNTTDSYVYLIPTYLLTALGIAEGAKVTLACFAGRKRTMQRLTAAVGIVALGAIPAWSVAQNYRTLDLSQDYTTQQWVDGVLAQLPQNSLLITGEDAHTFTLDYVRWVEHRRPDLVVVDGELLQHPWYAEQLARNYPHLLLDIQNPSLQQLVAANLKVHSVYLASARKELAQSFTLEPRGLLWEVTAAR
jgi:hypothetical protein